MKDFKTFLNEQKSMQSSMQNAASEKVGGLAGLGHVNPHEVLVTPTSAPTMLKSYTDAVKYDFSGFLKNLPSLDGDMMISDADKRKLSDVVDKMPDSHRKRNLINQMEKTMTLPKSADRTQKVQSIMKQVNDISMEAQGVDQSAFTPTTFIPSDINNINQWGNK